MARLDAEAERTDGARDKDFTRAGFAGFAGDFDATRVEALNFVGQAKRREFETIGAEGVGLDEVRTSFDVSLVYAEDGFGFSGIELVEAALRAYGFMEERAHRAVGDEDGVFEPFVEVENSHRKMGRNVS
jgi:hypothetical protein